MTARPPCGAASARHGRGRVADDGLHPRDACSHHDVATAEPRVGRDTIARIPPSIAFVTELYAPSIGGQQTRFEELAKRLAADGNEVTVICTRNDRSVPPVEDAGGVLVRRGPLLPRYERSNGKGLQRSPLGMLRFALRARRELRAGRFDGVYFNQWPYLHVLLAPRGARRRGGIDWCEYRTGLVHRPFQRLLPRLVAFNSTVNEWTGEQIERLSGVPQHYLPTGVDTSRYRHEPAAARRGVLFLGRLVENKNLPLLLAGYVELCRGGVDEPLRIAGDGPERDRLLEGIAALDAEVRQRIEVLGRIDEERKIELLATSRALLLPSRREGFPNVIAEAMASGLPIATVSSPLNGAAPVVRRYGVGVVGDPTVEGFARAVVEVLETADALSAHCLEVATELDWAVLGRRLERLLLDPLAAPPRRTAVDA